MVTAVIDYGLSNILSVTSAVRFLGSEVFTATRPDELGCAERIILPGVGAFGDGMNRLRNLGFDTAIKEEVSCGKPLLGICLGMQMLFDFSEEFGFHEGLGLIHGSVLRIPSRDASGIPQHVPNIGWNPLVPCSGPDFGSSFLGRISPGDECYFVHSYEAVPSDGSCRVADIIYGGRRICAAVQYSNIMGTQFHPEKSGRTGLAILNSFLA